MLEAPLSKTMTGAPLMTWSCLEHPGPMPDENPTGGVARCRRGSPQSNRSFATNKREVSRIFFMVNAITHEASSPRCSSSHDKYNYSTTHCGISSSSSGCKARCNLIPQPPFFRRVDFPRLICSFWGSAFAFSFRSK